MSKRRYKFQVENIEELERAFPQAVKVVEIPATIEKRARYDIVAKLLDCGIEVPGIQVTSGADYPVLKVPKALRGMEGAEDHGQ